MLHSGKNTAVESLALSPFANRRLAGSKIVTIEESMHRFISVVCMAEFVAANCCAEFKRFFASKGADFSDLVEFYRRVENEERNHFNLLKLALQGRMRIPVGMRQVFRGGLLNDDSTIYEKMFLVHVVFESGAMSFLGFLKNAADQGFPISESMVDAVRTILSDERDHIIDGIGAIEKYRQLDPTANGNHEKLLLSLARHAHFISTIPSSAGLSNEICDSIVSRFIRLYNLNLRRCFNEANL